MCQVFNYIKIRRILYEMNTLCTLQKIVPPRGKYEKLKNNLNKSTLAYGSAIASSYFITQGAEQGVSATVGVVSSLMYMRLLERHVDTVERSPFQNSC